MNKQSASLNTPTPSMWEALSSCEPYTWREVLVDIALAVAGDRARDSDGYRQLDAYLEDISSRDFKAGDSLICAFTAALGHAVGADALVGYALARTFPTSLEGLEDWPQRALELAGLDEKETVASGGPPDAA